MQNNDNNTDNKEQRWIDVPSFVNNNSRTYQSQYQLRKTAKDVDTDKPVKEVNTSRERQVTSDTKEGIDVKRKNINKKKKMPKAIKITLITLSFLTVVCCFLMFTNPGRKLALKMAGEYIYHKLDYQGSGNTGAADGNKAVNSTDYAYKDKVVNILLIGIEEIKDAKNTDSMIIATMNTQNHSLKLTSLMRDLFVQIPGYDRNRLNAAYSFGGIDLLYKTIEQNFGIKVDGYCMVNFKTFEKIVDLVDGVRVTLTGEEADYLNTTNYISNPANRHVKEGTQVLNGNQALGYCRVRKRPTATESNDFGRTQRQRIVLQAIYDKVKSKNILELALLMNKILDEISITTDIQKDDFNRYLEEAVNLKVNKIKTLRIPTDDNYENAKVTIGSHAGQEVLQPKDWDAARRTISDFINGTSSGAE